VTNSAAHQSSVGGGFTISQGGGSASFSHTNANANGSYAGVNEQAGIQAGDGGFNINVNGNTDLHGAVIASDGESPSPEVSGQLFCLKTVIRLSISNLINIYLVEVGGGFFMPRCVAFTTGRVIIQLLRPRFFFTDITRRFDGVFVPPLNKRRL
jgi:hypothetical protein